MTDTRERDKMWDRIDEHSEQLRHILQEQAGQAARIESVERQAQELAQAFGSLRQQDQDHHDEVMRALNTVEHHQLREATIRQTISRLIVLGGGGIGTVIAALKFFQGL